MTRPLDLALVAILCAAPCLHAQAAASPAAPAQAVPVAAREIPRGVELTAGDIAGDTAALASRIGWTTRRVIHEGEALREPGVVPAQLVRAGSEVTVRAEAGGVVVTRTGTALSSGSIGDHVRVRLDGQHTVTGTVSGGATVRIQ